jgi:hypothetical protein
MPKDKGVNGGRQPTIKNKEQYFNIIAYLEGRYKPEDVIKDRKRLKNWRKLANRFQLGDRS